MKKNILSGIFLILFIFCVQKLQAGDFFTEFYSEAVKANLTGLSTSAKLKIGIKEQKVDYYLYLFYEWADTTGTDLPFEYRYQGLTAGVEIRYWLIERSLAAILGYGFGLTDNVDGKNNFQYGLIGYHAFEKEKLFRDLYGELLWIGRADDVFMTLRYRHGKTLYKTPDTRLWAYGVIFLNGSGKGKNGTENRIEAGPGIGYIFLNGKASANLELKYGHSYRGNIVRENYFNPFFVISVGF